MNGLLEYKGYAGTIEFYSKDKILRGNVIGINSDIKYIGYSISEIESNFQTAIEEYLEECRQKGKEPDKVYKGNLRLRLPENMHKALDIASNSSGKSINTLIIDSIESYKPVKQILKQL